MSISFRLVALFGCAASLHLATAAAKEPKAAAKPTAPAQGVKTPGVQIPLANLKAEAELTLASPITGALFTDTIVLADAEAVHRFDARTNKPFEPSRDVKGIDKPCAGLLNAFSFVWTASCGTSSLAKVEMRPVRGPGGGGGGGRGGRGGAPAKPAADGAPAAEGAATAAAAKPEEAVAQAEAPTPAKPEETAAKADAPKPEPPPRTPPAPPAPPAFIPLGVTPTATTALAASDESVWLLADAKTSLQRIDPKENTIVAEVRLPSACSAILYAEKSLWVACASEAKLLRINPQTNLVDKRIEVAAEPVALAAGESSIWVLCRKEGKIARIDPKTDKVSATIDLGIPGANGMLAFGEGSLWASVPGFPVMRIAPATDKVAQQFHGEGGGVIHFGLASIWVASPDKSSKVTRFDPKRIVATLSE